MRTAEVSQLAVSAAYANVVVARAPPSRFAYLRAAFLAALLEVTLTVGHLDGGHGDLRSGGVR